MNTFSFNLDKITAKFIVADTSNEHGASVELDDLLSIEINGEDWEVAITAVMGKEVAAIYCKEFEAVIWQKANDELQKSFSEELNKAA